MKNKRILMAFIVVVAVSLLIGSFGCAQPVSQSPDAKATTQPTAAPAEKVIRLKAQTSWTTTGAPYGPFTQDRVGLHATFRIWMDWFNKRANGRVVIDVAEPGALFPIAEQDLAIAKGVADIAFAYGGYYAGRIPEADIELGGIFLFEDDMQWYEALHYYGLYKEFQQAYAKYGLYWTPVHWNGIVGIGTTFPAAKPEDFKGKKIRVVGIPASLIELLGASPVNIPYGEAYMAIKLGTAEGIVAGPGALEEIKLKEVLKGYVVEPNTAVALSGILINPKTFASLPADIQKIFQEESPYIGPATGEAWNRQSKWAMGNAEKEYGVKIYKWSAEDIAKITEKVRAEIWPKIAAKSPTNAKIMQIIEKQLRDYGRIK